MLQHFGPVNEMVEAGKFLCSGGFEALKVEIEKVKENYRITSESEELGPKCEEVLQKFQQKTVSVIFDGEVVIFKFKLLCFIFFKLHPHKQILIL